MDGQNPAPISNESKPTGTNPKTPYLARGDRFREPQALALPKGSRSKGHESQSKPGIKMVYPEPCKELRRKKAAATSSGWDLHLPVVVLVCCGSHVFFFCGSHVSCFLERIAKGETSQRGCHLLPQDPLARCSRLTV